MRACPVSANHQPTTNVATCMFMMTVRSEIGFYAPVRVGYLTVLTGYLTVSNAFRKCTIMTIHSLLNYYLPRYSQRYSCVCEILILAGFHVL